MRYILANNATATLSALLSTVATSATLANVSTTLATALGQVDANHRILLTLTDLSESVHEIVEVTAWNSGTSTATITRAQDGTTAAEWAAGSVAEIRTGVLQLRSLLTGTGADALAIGVLSSGLPTANASAAKAVAIGFATEASGGSSIAIGNVAEALGLRSIAIGNFAHAYHESCIAIGYQARQFQSEGALTGATKESVVIGSSTSSASEGERFVAIGHAVHAQGHRSVVIGPQAFCQGHDCVVLGGGAISDPALTIADCVVISGALNANPGSVGRVVVIGAGATADGSDDGVIIGGGTLTGSAGVAIGKGLSCLAADTVLIGSTGTANESGAIGIGKSVAAQGANCICIGDGATVYSEDSIAVGRGAQAYAARSLALGSQSRANVNHVGHIAALLWQPPSTAMPDTLDPGDAASRHRCSPLVTLATGILALDGGAPATAATLALPSGSLFFIDRIDVVVTSASTPGGSPAIQVGTDDAGNIDSILAASAVTITEAGNRQSFTPSSPHGVGNIYISVQTAGSGVLKCRVFVVGYLVGNE